MPHHRQYRNAFKALQICYHNLCRWGFGYNGLHNILEAAVYGKPVIFGPEYEKNFEAVEMIDCTGAISIESAIELEKVVNNLLDNHRRNCNHAEMLQKIIFTKMQEPPKKLSTTFRRTAF